MAENWNEDIASTLERLGAQNIELRIAPPVEAPALSVPADNRLWPDD
jgi:hypothetical protein